MTAMSVVEARCAHRARDPRSSRRMGTVWIAISPHWWDLATWLWWRLCPLSKKAWVTLTTNDKRRIRSRAVRVAKGYVILGTNVGGAR